uniref:Uncharacterized protein n=1 Tax=Aegilops tauschii subsp. strangulata TaxID=200361 RepID=A0A453JM70_AEGTS
MTLQILVSFDFICICTICVMLGTITLTLLYVDRQFWTWDNFISSVSLDLRSSVRYFL